MALFKVKQGRGNDGQLPLSPGDIVTVNRDTKIQVRVWASMSNGKEGYVPLDCIEKLPDSEAMDPVWTAFCCHPNLILEQIFPTLRRNKATATATSPTGDKSTVGKTPLLHPLLHIWTFLFPPTTSGRGVSSEIDKSNSQAIEAKQSTSRHKEATEMKPCINSKPFNDIPMKPTLSPKRNGIKRHHYNPFDDESKLEASEYKSTKKKQCNYNPFDDEPIVLNSPVTTRPKRDSAMTRNINLNPFDDEPRLSSEIGMPPTPLSGKDSETYQNPFD